jgi:hypothetical protein
LPAEAASDGVHDFLPLEMSIGEVFWVSAEGFAMGKFESATGGGLAIAGSVAAWPLLLSRPNVEGGRTRGVNAVAPYKLRLA